MLAPRIVPPPVEWLDLFLRSSHRRQYPAKTTIIHHGDVPETLYYILDGSVSVVIEDDDGREIVLAYLSAGDFFGEMGLFDEASQRSAWVVARTKCELAEMNYVVLADGVEITAKPIVTVSDVKAPAGDAEKTLTVNLDKVIHPSLAGLGGAFNEQGGEAFMRLSEDARNELAEALFNPKTGAGLTLCRTAIGASDFGLGAYSYSETPKDYRMTRFSVERDTTSVIPFIRAAMAENPELKIYL